MDELACLNLFIKLKDSEDHDLIDQITNELESATPKNVKAHSVYIDK